MRKLLVIGTGGTISCVKGKDGLEPSFPVSELVARIDVPCDIQTEQLFNIDSTNMTPRHWEQLARHIRERYGEFDGFVITHGTDTMAYAAASLACLIQNSRKPIVFTGSMLPMTAENSDAPKNLRDAVTFAADKSAFGVNVVFSGYVYDGRYVSKADSASLEPFFSMVHKERVGCWNDGQLVFNRRFCGETRFFERLSDEVFHVKLIPGQKLYVPEDTKALILESYGLGGVPDHMLEKVKALAERGVYVIIATQCAYGGTDINCYAVGHADFPLLETGKMTVEYATAKARWALAYSNRYDEFKKLFTDEVDGL